MSAVSQLKNSAPELATHQKESETLLLAETVAGQTRRLKILLVDDNDSLRSVMPELLERHDFEIVSVCCVSDALSQIISQGFDVLVTDLHMPKPQDGFAVIAAMRHCQPKALTLVVSGFPDINGAVEAILLQADQVLVRPFVAKELADLVRQKAHACEFSPKHSRECVASILERDKSVTIERWLWRVEQVEELAALPVMPRERVQHLPRLMRSIEKRLRKAREIGPSVAPSPAAVVQGKLRHRQGYTIPLIVQESRILQVCLFETLQRNLSTVDFNSVLPDVMLIADEVDSQLSQTLESFLTMDASAAPFRPSLAVSKSQT
jgi:ActR/RegA family two-component response regulator